MPNSNPQNNQPWPDDFFPQEQNRAEKQRTERWDIESINTNDTPPEPTARPQSRPQPQNAPAGGTYYAAPSSKKTPPQASRAPKRGKRRTGGFWHSRKKMLLASIVVGVLMVALLAVAVLASLNDDDGNALSLPGATASQLLTESGYDPNVHSIPLSQLGNTVLGQTEDAGADYVKDTLFLGDSNTVRMLSYRDITNVTLDNSIGVEGMGIQAVTTLGTAKFKGKSSMVTMPEAVKIMQPRRVVITFGTNNAGGMSVDSFIKSYKSALDAIHTSYPYSDIIIGAVPPVAKRHINEALTMTAIDQYNLALAKLAEQEGYKFLNWSETLKDPANGFAKEGYMLTSDGIHISRSGMEAMFQYFRTHAYITEDTRPKPLAAIPAREGTLPSVVSKDPSGSFVGDKSSSASASSKVGTANVVFSASEGGAIAIGGNTTASATFEVALGGTCPDATAIPMEGYAFSYWTCSVGRLDPYQARLVGFKVFSTVQAGDTVTVTAVFTKIPVSSSAPPPPPSSTPPVPSTSLVETDPAPPAEGGNVTGEENAGNIQPAA